MSFSESSDKSDESALERELTELRWLSELAYRLIRDSSLAEDACQEVWLAASREGTAALDRGRFALLLRRFAWRSRRAEARQRRREATAARPESCPSVDELLAAGEQRLRLWQHLKDLDEPFRTTLLLRFQEELSTTEIADRLGVAIDTVRWRVRRGLEFLRTSLERDERGGLSALALAIPDSSHAYFTSQSAASIGAPAALLAAGGMVLSKLVIALVLVSAIATVWIRFPRDAASRRVPIPHAENLASGDLQKVLSTPESAEGLPANSTRRPTTSLADLSEETEPAGPALLVGRVVGAMGKSVPAAQLELSGRDWVVKSLAAPDGAFRLELPANGAPRADLVITGPEHLQQVELMFMDGYDEQPTLNANPGSVTDIGEIRLGPAGIVTGYLVPKPLEQGGPSSSRGGDSFRADVAGAWIRVGGSSAQSGPLGHFVVSHVPAGDHEILVLAPGFLEERIQTTVRFEQSNDVGAIELTLSPRVQGQVLSSLGHPLPDASVSSRSLSRGWVFEVDHEGRFDIPLPTLENCEVTAYAPGHQQPYFETPVRPSADDVEIVLSFVGQPCSVRVVSAETGDPISYFCVDIDHDSAIRRGDCLRPRLAFDPNHEHESTTGWVRFSGEPGRDVVEIAAKGYRSTAQILEPVAASTGQVIALRKPASLSGRIVHNGTPVAGAEVVLSMTDLTELRAERDGIDRVELLDGSTLEREIRAQGGRSVIPVRTPASETFESTAPATCMYNAIPLGFAEERKCTTDADGRFNFTNVLARALRFEARHGRLAARSEIRYLPREESLEFGDLELAPLSRIVGQLAPDAAFEQGGLGGHVISVPEVGAETTTDAQGRFVLEDLVAGGHLLRVRLGSWVYSASSCLRSFVYVPAGSTSEVTLGLNARPAATVRLSFLLNGEARPKGHFSLRDEDNAGDSKTMRSSVAVTLCVPADRPLQPSIGLGRTLIEFGAPVSFPPGGPHEVELELRAGRLEVELPKGLALAHDTVARLRWGDSHAPEDRPPLRGDLGGFDGRAASFAIVPEEALDLRLELKSKTAGGPARLWSLDAVVTAGETTRIVLE